MRTLIVYLALVAARGALAYNNDSLPHNCAWQDGNMVMGTVECIGIPRGVVLNR